MNRLGILTGADLKRQPIALLLHHFGKAGSWYHAIAHGEDDRAVVADRPRKSAGSETTFADDLTSPEEIEQGVRAMAGEVWNWCETAKAFDRDGEIKYADFQQVTRGRTLPAVIRDHDLLSRVGL